MTVGRTWSNIVINTVEYYIKDNILQIVWLELMHWRDESVDKSLLKLNFRHCGSLEQNQMDLFAVSMVDNTIMNAFSLLTAAATLIVSLSDYIQLSCDNEWTYAQDNSNYSILPSSGSFVIINSHHTTHAYILQLLLQTQQTMVKGFCESVRI